GEGSAAAQRALHVLPEAVRGGAGDGAAREVRRAVPRHSGSPDAAAAQLYRIISAKAVWCSHLGVAQTNETVALFSHPGTTLTRLRPPRVLGVRVSAAM